MADTTSKHAALYSGGASKAGLAKKLGATFYGEDLMDYPGGTPGPTEPKSTETDREKRGRELGYDKEKKKIVASVVKKRMASKIPLRTHKEK